MSEVRGTNQAWRAWGRRTTCKGSEKGGRRKDASKAWNERKEGAKGREEKNGSKVTQTERRAKRVEGRKNRDCRKSKPKHQIGSANCKRKQKQEKKHSLIPHIINLTMRLSERHRKHRIRRSEVYAAPFIDFCH